MLAVVRTPHIVEVSIQGTGAEAVLAAIRRRFPVQVVAQARTGDDSESVPVEQTSWWRKTEKNRAGNLLAGARLKHRLTQTELARRSGVPQGHISAMENGRLKVSLAAAEKLGKALGEDLAGRLFGEKGLQAKPRVRKG